MRLPPPLEFSPEREDFTVKTTIGILLRLTVPVELGLIQT